MRIYHSPKTLRLSKASNDKSINDKAICDSSDDSVSNELEKYVIEKRKKSGFKRDDSDVDVDYLR